VFFLRVPHQVSHLYRTAGKIVSYVWPDWLRTEPNGVSGVTFPTELTVAAGRLHDIPGNASRRWDNIIKMGITELWTRHVADAGEMRNACKI
jgi:hypothetical protein